MLPRRRLCRRHFNVSLIVACASAATSQCRTSGPQDVAKSSMESHQPAVWRDVSVGPTGDAAPCVITTSPGATGPTKGESTAAASTNQLCMFAHTASGLMWTAPARRHGTPLLLPWSAAIDYCRSIKADATNVSSASPWTTWRLPTTTEYADAAKDRSQQPEALNLIAFGDQSAAFGAMHPGEFFWTNSGEDDGNQIWTATRAGARLNFALQSVHSSRPFRCVRSLYPDVATTPSPSAAYTYKLTNTGKAGPSHKARQLARTDDRGSRPTRLPKAPAYLESDIGGGVGLTTASTDSDSPAAAHAGAAKSPYSTFELSRIPDEVRETPTRKRISSYIRHAFDVKGFDNRLLNAASDLLIAPASGFVLAEANNQIPAELIVEASNILHEYVRVLAAMATLESLPMRVQIIGYASPTFHGLPQQGFKEGDEGGTYNRVQGLKSAEQIYQLLLTFPEAKALKIEKITMGSDGAIFTTTGRNRKCGDYDCLASRRVELRFHTE